MNSLESVRIGDYYTPQKKQQLFHNSSARYPLAEGGRGGGKTTALLWEAISQCLLVDGANCLLLRRTLTAMEKGGIEDIFVKNVPRGLYRSYNASKHVVRFPNGSNLFFGHIKTDADLMQYQGAEFLFIGWEELTQFTYRQWDYLKGSNRCPVKTYELDGVTYDTRPRMAAVTNPNGIGSGWVKALWITKHPVGEMAVNYNPRDYEAVHSTFEDNYVYRNDANYIATLNSIVDPVLRMAWIPGSWDILAGQFFQNWDPERHVKQFGEVVFESWQPRWISIDWGFEHATVVLWWTRVRLKEDDLDPHGNRSILLVYRQLILRHTNEELVAEKIVAANHTGDKFDHLRSIYLSPDRFAHIDQHHSIADKMGDVFVRYDLPRPERANNRRVDGWRLCYTLLDTDGVAVLASCRDVIESIPQLQRDEKDVEDAQKDGNDLYLDVCESFRYGVMSYASAERMPREVEFQERIKKIEDPTAKYMEYLRLSSKPRSDGMSFTLPRKR
jgi:phage terminase large subunit